jgi:hypothetical protein
VSSILVDVFEGVVDLSKWNSRVASLSRFRDLERNNLNVFCCCWCCCCILAHVGPWLFIYFFSQSLLSAVRAQVPAAGGWEASTNVSRSPLPSPPHRVECTRTVLISEFYTISPTNQSLIRERQLLVSFVDTIKQFQNITMTPIDWSKMKINRTNVVSKRISSSNTLRERKCRIRSTCQSITITV